MRLSIYYGLLLSFSIRYSCTSRLLQLRNWDENHNRNALECLETLIGSTDWVTREFTIIFDDANVIDDNFFARYENFRWKLQSTKNDNLTGFSNTIIVTRNFDSLNETLNAVNIQPMDSRAKYIVSVTENFPNLDSIRRASVASPAAMWKSDKTNVVYLVKCKDDILVMTYFPFVRNCQVGELEVLDIWRKKSFAKGRNVYPEKMLDIHGCVQNHSVLYQDETVAQVREEYTETGDLFLGGVSGRLMAIIAEKMNITLNLSTEHPESWDVLQDQVKRGESLFAAAGGNPIASLHKFIDQDCVYMQESFAFGYITGGFEVSWKNLVWPLSKEVWAYTGYTFLLFSGLLFIANRCQHSAISVDKLRILDGFGVLLGASRILARNFFGRYLFGVWILFSYVITASYNCGLVSFLTTPNERRVINTFEELLIDGMQFGGSRQHRSFYYDPSDPIMMNIYNKFNVWQDNEGMSILRAREGATGVYSSTVDVYNNNVGAGNVNDHIRKLNQNTLILHMPISIRRGSPFRLGICRHIAELIQSGLRDYWLNYYTRGISSTRIITKTPSAISTQHLRGILYFHVAGLICSCMIFLGELIFHKYVEGRELQ